MSPIEPLSPPSAGDIDAAIERIRDFAIRTPLIHFENDAGIDIWLKLENLQPIGSFKIRGAANAIGICSKETLAGGVITASAGNMAQGVAWCARAMGLRCDVVVPDSAPRTKLDAIERLGATIHPVPFDRWWQTMVERHYPGLTGQFIHPVSDPGVVAGNATAGLEIHDELPGVGAVIVPFGGGGLSCGIAAALRSRGSRAAVYAAEVETAAPLAASLQAGRPVKVDYRRSFVDGIGAKQLLPEMWPMARELLRGSLTVSLDQVADAIRRLVLQAKTVAEGAGAAALAATLSGAVADGPVVCVVSGGNLDVEQLETILAGRTPG